MSEFGNWVSVEEQLPLQISIDLEMRKALEERLNVDLSTSEPVLVHAISRREHMGTQLVAVYSHRDRQWLIYSPDGSNRAFFQMIATHWMALPDGPSGP